MQYICTKPPLHPWCQDGWHAACCSLVDANHNPPCSIFHLLAISNVKYQASIFTIFMAQPPEAKEHVINSMILHLSLGFSLPFYGKINPVRLWYPGVDSLGITWS